MLINLLVASLIPFLIWVFQKATDKTGPKATYLRRRIFAYGMLIVLIINVIGIINIFQEVGDSAGLSRVLVRNIFYWVLLFKFGLSNKPNEDKGFFYSIWQPYKAEYIALNLHLDCFLNKIFYTKYFFDQSTIPLFFRHLEILVGYS